MIKQFKCWLIFPSKEHKTEIQDSALQHWSSTFRKLKLRYKFQENERCLLCEDNTQVHFGGKFMPKDVSSRLFGWRILFWKRKRVQGI